MGTRVSSVLKHKGHDVVTVAPQQTVTWVVKVLARNRIGAVPVSNRGHQKRRRRVQRRQARAALFEIESGLIWRDEPGSSWMKGDRRSSALGVDSHRLEKGDCAIRLLR